MPLIWGGNFIHNDMDNINTNQQAVKDEANKGMRKHGIRIIVGCFILWLMYQLIMK